MKRYDKEFRKQALKLSDEVGIKKASEQLGVIYATLAEWRKQRIRKNNSKQESTGNPDEENARLKREVSELQKANSILKDALGFFVEDRKR